MSSMRFEFLVEVEAEREQGKFATRDEISTAIQEALEGADLGSFEGDEGGQYNITWTVSEQAIEKPKRKRRNITVTRTGPTSARVTVGGAVMQDEDAPAGDGAEACDYRQTGTCAAKDG